MKAVQKMVAVFLVLAVFSINLVPAFPRACQTDAEKAMSCCAAKHTASNQNAPGISPVRCGCAISNTASRDIPVNAVPVSMEQLKKNEKKADVTLHFEKTGVSQENGTFSKFEIFYHPKFSAKTKIYTLVESYLI